jgi:hypothetical protein
LDIELERSDPAKLSVTDTFRLRVEAPPRFVTPIPSQVHQVGELYTYFIDQKTFEDPNQDSISYSAVLNGTNTLPPWLSFSASGIFAGTPSVADAGLYTIEVNAFDGILQDTASTTFDLSIIKVLENQKTRVDGQFTYSIEDPIVNNPQGPVQYSATLLDGSPLPSWLQFEAITLTFSGSPTAADLRDYTILVTGNDGVITPVSVSFSIMVEENVPPRVANPLSNQVASVNQNYQFTVPDTTFEDSNSDPLTYTARKAGKTELPNWLNFDAQSRTFFGKPGREDTGHFGDAVYPIEVVASDGTQQASSLFDLTVQGVSNAEITLAVAGPLASLGALAFAWYKKRGMVLNQLNKKEYQQSREIIQVGEGSFVRKLAVDSNDVKLVKAFKDRRTLAGIRVSKRFEEIFTHDRSLPGGLLLPNWLTYDFGENQLCVCRTLKPSDAGTYIIRVYSHGEVIKEEFELEVVDPNAPISSRGKEVELMPM